MLSDIYKAIMVELIHEPLFSDLWSVCMLNAVVQQPWSKSRGFGSVFKLLSPPVIRAVLNRCSSVPVVDSTRTYAFTKTTHARTRTLDNRTPCSAWRTLLHALLYAQVCFCWWLSRWYVLWLRGRREISDTFLHYTFESQNVKSLPNFVLQHTSSAKHKFDFIVLFAAKVVSNPAGLGPEHMAVKVCIPT